MKTIVIISILSVTTMLAGCGVQDGSGDDKAKLVPTEEQKSLAREIDENIKKAQGTPGQEAANSMHSSWLARFHAILKGDIPAKDKKELATATAKLRQHNELIAKGLNWPRPPHIKIPRAEKAPQIDGKLDDQAWKDAAAFTGLYLFNEKEKLTEPATTWKVMWDEEYLYFAFDCEDSDIVSPEVPRDDHVYFNDCVEIFIQPLPRTGMYWEIVISPTGMIFDALQNKKPHQRGKVARKDADVEGMKIGRTVRGTPNDSSDIDRGYTIEVAVPFDQLPEYSLASPAVGHTMTLLLVRLDRTGDPKKWNFRTYSFIPLLSWGHNVWNHASAELVE